MSILSELPFVRGQKIRVAAGLRRYRGEIAAIEPELLWVTVREESGTEHPPTIGDEVTVHATREMDARYELTAVVDHLETGLVNTVGLRVIGSRRVQDREYVRVPLALPPVRSTVVYQDGEEREIKLGLLDISASGARLGIDAHLNPGDEIVGEFCLPGTTEALPFRAVVMRVAEKPSGSIYKTAVGAAFVDLAPRLRERIIQFVLKAQRELRQRGLTR